MAGMWVDYYVWALVLGVGWQGWNNVCILLLCNYSLEWFSLCCAILAVSATGLVSPVADGQTDRRMDRRTDVTKLIVAFRNLASAPKNETKTVKRRQNSPNFVQFISVFPQ
jgi:ABC-type bacteriocin/lantibiotic exporter with double-glycine peptidase domain